MHHPTGRITHTTAFVPPVVEHCLEREIDGWIHHENSEVAGGPLNIRSGLESVLRHEPSTYGLYGS